MEEIEFNNALSTKFPLKSVEFLSSKVAGYDPSVIFYTLYGLARNKVNLLEDCSLNQSRFCFWIIFSVFSKKCLELRPIFFFASQVSQSPLLTPIKCSLLPVESSIDSGEIREKKKIHKKVTMGTFKKKKKVIISVEMHTVVLER